MSSRKSRDYVHCKTLGGRIAKGGGGGGLNEEEKNKFLAGKVCPGWHWSDSSPEIDINKEKHKLFSYNWNKERKKEIHKVASDPDFLSELCLHLFSLQLHIKIIPNSYIVQPFPVIFIIFYLACKLSCGAE